MRTFDLAIQYLNEIDFKQFPVVVTKPGEFIQKVDKAGMHAVQKALADFHKCPENNRSNKYYRSVCFETAINHLLFKAHGWVSFFDVAIEIVEANKDVLKTDYKKWVNTTYPDVMLQHWIKYCDELKVKTIILESEMREELFFTAYTYIMEPDKA